MLENISIDIGSTRRTERSQASAKNIFKQSGGSAFPKGSQARVSIKLSELYDIDGPAWWSYASMITYLMSPRTSSIKLRTNHEEEMESIVSGLLDASGGGVYLVDGGAYIKQSLIAEFPELMVFKITIENSFIEAPFHKGVFVETKKFADLRTLSRMRREVKRTGLTNNYRAADVIKILLGLETTATA